MRLINTHTLEFEEFEEQHVPSYAILSHRWEEEEVSFKDVERGTAVRKKGWQKITKCCEQARKHGLSYVWVDTCCIDKSSSAELTEAINSMFRWYQRSERCYVYLCDVHLNNSIWQKWESLNFGFDKWSRLTEQKEETSLPRKLPKFSRGFLTEFCSSLWFTRGWTLQELLANENMIFFGHRWQMLGTKDFLCAPISHTTCIPASILIFKETLDDVTIAERMSWAAKRETTRIEDRAYSLMGIFDVHMSMLYGEGEAAFMRLQEEIIKRSDDQSILLWDSDQLGLLAKSPAAFGIRLPKSVDVSMCSFYPFDQSSFGEEITYSWFEQDTAFVLTNVGLSITLSLIPWYLDIYLVPLKVRRTIEYKGGFSHYIAHIFLKQQTNDLGRLHRVRFSGEAFTYIDEDTSFRLETPHLDSDDSEDVVEVDDEPLKRQFMIAHKDLTSYTGVSRRIVRSIYGIRFAFEPNEIWVPDGILRTEDVIARQRWSPQEGRIVLEAGVWGALAVFRVTYPSGKPSYIYVGFNQNFNPCLVQRQWDHDLTFDEIVQTGLGSDELSQVLAA